MNRPGQPPQRPPSLGPNPGLAGPFRSAYPSYGLPHRNVIQTGFMPMQQPNPRTSVPSMPPQPSPGFLQQQRGSSSFAFGGSLGQPQTQSQQLQQQHANSQQQPQQQTNGSSNSLPPHLAQQSASAPSLGGTAPSVSSASEVGLDPNDFPALGSSAPTNTNNANNGTVGSGGSSSVTTSYASQAGTGVLLGGTPGTGASLGGSNAGSGANTNSNPTREFTSDDFPALGQQQSSQQQQNQETSHPPGLNGFQHNDSAQQHRQNLLGSLASGGSLPSGTPGMLNLAPTQARNVHPGFQHGQSEAEKQQQQRNNYALKLNQASHAAWNSSSNNSGPAAQVFPPSTISSTQQNGSHSNPNSNQQEPNQSGNQNLSQPLSQPQPQSSQQLHLNAPPGVPPLSGSFIQQGQQPSASAATPANPNPNPTGSTPAPYHSNGLENVPPTSAAHPQTPAQQVLMSAADRWGLLGLLAMIKNAPNEVDGGLSSVGTDLGTMGLDMGYGGNLYSTFITPWADQSAAHSVEPDFHLPACYNVLPPPPGPNKAAAFSDETLFFMFYSSPRDALQEVAAQELWNRNWRYHKDLRLWITKESGTVASQKITGGESGTYTFWDSENWGKERKEMTVLYTELEEKNIPAFVQGAGLVLAQGQQPAVQQQQTQRGSFQMGVAGL